MQPPAEHGEIRPRLRAALKVAMQQHDADAIAALRSAAAAIDNAEAIERPEPSTPRVGLGAGEATRKELSASEVMRIVRAEIAERISAAEGYERAGRHDAGRHLRAQADAILRAVAS